MKRNHIGLLTISGFVAFLFGPSLALAQTIPPLGAATSFTVLGGQTVTNTGPTIITGDLGVSPGSAITGSPTVVAGTIHAADALAAQAQFDAGVAYDDLDMQPCTQTFGVPTDLGGMTLVPGVYCFSVSAAVTGAVPLILDALGNTNAVWVFSTVSTLTLGSGSSVVVMNGGQNCNVFWQVGSSAVLNTTSTLPGTIIALTDVNLLTGANVTGRTIARNGQVTLDSNMVGGCAAPAVFPAIPTLDFAGLMILIALLAGAGLFVMKRFSI